jgi:CRISPR-associated protein Cas2
MILLILENAAASLRGELSRWMIEPRAGTFVGTVAGMVRDKLWDKIGESMPNGGATMIYSSNNEQGFRVKSFGETGRSVVNVEGLDLVCIPSHAIVPRIPKEERLKKSRA